MPGKEFWENGRDKHENGGLAFKMPPKRIHNNTGGFPLQSTADNNSFNKSGFVLKAKIIIKK